ncbi:MAG: hypothetical protein LBF72_04120 [Holosporales bacterium]|nr:hypothetical protein [Holosporales bacterium]
MCIFSKKNIKYTLKEIINQISPLILFFVLVSLDTYLLRGLTALSTNVFSVFLFSLARVSERKPPLLLIVLVGFLMDFFNGTPAGFYPAMNLILFLVTQEKQPFLKRRNHLTSFFILAVILTAQHCIKSLFLFLLHKNLVFDHVAGEVITTYTCYCVVDAYFRQKDQARS